MNELNSIGIQDLEECVGNGTPVKVHISALNGEDIIEGEIIEHGFPWSLTLIEYILYSKDEGKTSVGGSLTFAGITVGITRIEKRDGQPLYVNDRIPIPYPTGFSQFMQEGLIAMNNLRRRCFGEGFDYKLFELNPISQR